MASRWWLAAAESGPGLGSVAEADGAGPSVIASFCANAAIGLSLWSSSMATTTPEDPRPPGTGPTVMLKAPSGCTVVSATGDASSGSSPVVAESPGAIQALTFASDGSHAVVPHTRTVPPTAIGPPRSQVSGSSSEVTPTTDQTPSVPVTPGCRTATWRAYGAPGRSPSSRVSVPKCSTTSSTGRSDAPGGTTTPAATIVGSQPSTSWANRMAV